MDTGSCVSIEQKYPAVWAGYSEMYVILQGDDILNLQTKNNILGNIFVPTISQNVQLNCSVT